MEDSFEKPVSFTVGKGFVTDNTKSVITLSDPILRKDYDLNLYLQDEERYGSDYSYEFTKNSDFPIFSSFLVIISLLILRLIKLRLIKEKILFLSLPKKVSMEKGILNISFSV